VLDRPDVRQALADHDLGRVFFLARRWGGISYAKIADSTGIKPERVGAIARGRACVTSYTKIAAVADGLRIPGHLLGLAPRWWENTDPHPGRPGARRAYPAPPRSGDMDEPVQVRLLLAHAAEVTMGVGDGATGPVWDAPAQESTPVPARVGAGDVEQIEQVTAALRALDHRHGGGACRDAVLAQTRWVSRLLDAEATEAVRQRLHVTLADLHNLGGWTSMDLGLYPAARRLFAHAITHARHAEASSLLANVLYRTGRLHLHRAMTGQALRFFQLGQIAAQDAGDARTVAVLCANEAWAYALLGDRAQAIRSLARAGDELARAEPATDAPWVGFFGHTDLDALTGMTYLELSTSHDNGHGRADLDQATTALHRTMTARGADTARSLAFEVTALATATLRTGDHDIGLALGHQAVAMAEQLRSVRVVDRLAPLALEASRTATTDAADLTRAIAAMRTV
jgi:tetratricopeptide (TPR) repeat protein